MGFNLTALFALVIAVLTFGASADDSDIHIQDPWVRAAPPSVNVMAAYMKITNSGDKPRKLIGASSPDFERVEMHRSVMHNNMTHMEHQQAIVIPPHTAVTFNPGELHLMLMGPKKTLHINDSTPMTLSFDNGEEITFTATVRSGQPEN
jgi:copper(I)-binding protein